MSSISQQGGDRETARAIARPPFLFLVALLLGFVSDHLVPLPFPISRIGPAHWISAVIAGSLILIGIGIFAAGNRNYLGMFLVYGGIGIAVRSPWILILALPLAITMRYGVVAREEAYLERRFGDAYRDYKARVRRWL